MTGSSLRDRLARAAAVVAFVATVGGFGLAFGGTLDPDRSLLARLGYARYDDLAFLVGVAGLLGGIAYGYLRSERDGRRGDG